MENNIIDRNLIEVIYDDNDLEYITDGVSESIYDEILEVEPNFFNNLFVTRATLRFNTISGFDIMKNLTKIICIEKSPNKINNELNNKENVSIKSYSNNLKLKYVVAIINLCTNYNILILIETHLINSDLILNSFVKDLKSDKYYNKWKDKNKKNQRLSIYFYRLHIHVVGKI